MATDFFDLSQSGSLDRSSLPIESSPTSDSGPMTIPPAHRGALMLPLCFPSIVLGMIAVLLGTWLFQSPVASFVTFGGCLCGLLVTVALFRRQERSAISLLNRPNLRNTSLAETGVFASLLGELVHRLERHETKARELADHRARLEARAHLLKTQVRRLIHTLDLVEQPVFLLDSGNTLVYRNAAATTLLTAVTGHPEAPAAVAWESMSSLKVLAEAVRSRSAAADKRTAEVELKCSGELITYRAEAANLYDEEGRQSAISIVLSDIREQVLETAKQAQFVSSVSHELKTPLASIRAYTELLMDDVDDPDERLELLQFIDEQVDRLTRLVNNLLNFARVESGVIKVQREDVDINRIARKAIEVVGTAAKEKQITVVDELSDLYLPAHLDVDLFGQAIINLLSNAVKYTPTGGQIRVRTRMQDTEAVIEVQDNGMGIPAESLPRLFERFYRVPQNSKAAPGTGLGLALVKYIVTNIHDGAISATSQVNQGSTFSITVPLGHRGRGARPSQAQRTVS